MRFHFLTTERHFHDHLQPVWDALSDAERGMFVAREVVATPRVWRSPEDPPVKAHIGWQSEVKVRPADWMPGDVMVTASWGDFARARARSLPAVLFEHGLGQTYIGDDRPSYAGSTNETRASALAFIVPNQHAADANHRALPHVPNYVVGVPRMDTWHRRPPKEMGSVPVVAVAFHWDCTYVPETQTSWPWFKDALPALAARYQVLGHGHPRIYEELVPEYCALGIEPVRTFNEVLERADVFICDNSSTLFEFASTGRPVVVMNPPWYRRSVEHGLRFWRCSGIGVNVEHPDELVPAVERSLGFRGSDWHAMLDALDYAMPFRDGWAASRAVEALRVVGALAG